MSRRVIGAEPSKGSAPPAMLRAQRSWSAPHAIRARRRVALAGLLLLAGCRPTMTPVPEVRERPAPLADPTRHPGRALLMIAMPDSAAFRVVRRSLIEELKDDFDITTFVVRPKLSLPEFRQRIERERPRALVVMDNPTLSLYRSYAAASTQGQPVPPAVVVMTSFLEELAPIPGVTGVAYEVPAVTAFVQLRSIISSPLNRVAVLHRPGFRDMVRRQTALAAKEQITLLPFEVDSDPSPGQIRDILRLLSKTRELDALWVLNDNGLLRDASFRAAAWGPELERLHLPVIVGLPNLVTGQAHFGDFAVVPDHEAMGVQAAQLIFKLADSDWQVGVHPIEPPFSTLTIANLKRLGALVGLRTRADERVDRVIE
jgi:hypothetical protein